MVFPMAHLGIRDFVAKVIETNTPSRLFSSSGWASALSAACLSFNRFACLGSEHRLTKLRLPRLLA